MSINRLRCFWSMLEWWHMFAESVRRNYLFLSGKWYWCLDWRLLWCFWRKLIIAIYIRALICCCYCIACNFHHMCHFIEQTRTKAITRKGFRILVADFQTFGPVMLAWSTIGPVRIYSHPEKDKAAYIQRQIRDNPSRPSNFQGRNQQEEQYSGQELTDTKAVQLFILTVCGFLIQAITQIWFQDRYHPRYFLF